MCLFYGSCALISPNHTLIKHRDLIKKSNPITPIYLSERHEFYFPVVGVMDGVWISLGPMSIGGVVVPLWTSEHRVEGKNINSFACFKSCFDLLDLRFGTSS